MRRISRTNQFKRDYKRESRGQYRLILDELLTDVITCLVSDTVLPPQYRDHALVGNWSDCRDCHLKPDLVLIYQITNNDITLIRLGSHAELFR
ncbi:type II toxin-antitoxin system YafQ family toxin [Dolichospermum sp. ST_con]|jgi:mRNA interferase YafQ|nr:type II toxin-antitoxin system YafQ family toxin [Dolichospermum sp. ST_con]